MIGQPLVYRPWVPQAGMSGWYAHLVKAWGNPNIAQHQWPPETLALVCERSADAQEVVYDSSGGGMLRYYFI